MSNDKTSTLPSVSIIVPVYNAENDIAKLIESLLAQDYPKELFEILIVDNNSSDRTKEIIKQYPVKLLEEKEIQSSYAARNIGIKNAKNEILAFTDSDCIADPQWIRKGIKTLVSKSADLAGGKVMPIYSTKKTAAEFYDSITNMQNELYIRKRCVSTTANLFVRFSLFNSIGLFSDQVESGGDIQWTGKAAKNGFSFVYAPDAVVKHPTRLLKALLKKQYRVGTGIIPIEINEGKSQWELIYFILRSFLPRRFYFIKRDIHQCGTKEMNKKILSIWCVSYLYNLATLLGVLKYIFHSIFKYQNPFRIKTHAK